MKRTILSAIILTLSLFPCLAQNTNHSKATSKSLNKVVKDGGWKIPIAEEKVLINTETTSIENLLVTIQIYRLKTPAHLPLDFYFYAPTTPSLPQAGM